MTLHEWKVRIEQELERLGDELIIHLPQHRGGDLTRVEVEASRGEQRELEACARRLGQILAALPNVDPEMLDLVCAGLGSRVTVLDRSSGEQIAYTLLAGSFIDLDAGEVSLGSPIGQALLGRVAGDEVDVRTPRGVRNLVVQEVVTLARQMECLDAEPVGTG